MKFKKYLTQIIFTFIVFVGIFLRIYLVENIPPGLNIDEAAIGYNSYSILKTGLDEHGKFMPLTLESFGDWKLPLYSYVSTIPISIFELSVFSTRLVSIISGIVGIFLIYYISSLLFSKKSISLVSAFLYAVSPWSIFFSRAAYEVNLATTVFLGGFLFFLLGTKKARRNRFYLFFSGILFGLTLFAYHSYIIFMPLFVIFLSFYSFKRIRKKIMFLIIPFTVFVFVSGVSSYSGGLDKFTTTTVLNNNQIVYERVDKFRKDTVSHPIIFDKIHTRYLGVPYEILQNYLLSFSPEFLFDKGGEKLVHNLDGFGNLYIVDAFLILAGLIGLFYFKEKNKSLIIAWVFICPIPSALTVDAPNSTRLFILMPAFVLLSSYGVWVVYSLMYKKILGRIFLGALVFIFMINFLFFLNLYFIHFQYNRAIFWRSGYEKLPVIANEYSDKKIVMQGVYDYPYIYFLFFNKYDPDKFRREVVYYPKTKEGFKYVKSFGRYRFVHALADEKEEPDTLYFDNQNFHPGDNFIKIQNGDPVFKYYTGKE
jgi:hypothetical protein